MRLVAWEGRGRGGKIGEMESWVLDRKCGMVDMICAGLAWRGGKGWACECVGLGYCDDVCDLSETCEAGY